VTSSGTLGDPVTFALTNSDLDRLAYNEQISLACAGGTKNDIYQLMTTLDRRFMAGLAYFMGIKQMGAGVVRVGNACLNFSGTPSTVCNQPLPLPFHHSSLN